MNAMPVLCTLWFRIPIWQQCIFAASIEQFIRFEYENCCPDIYDLARALDYFRVKRIEDCSYTLVDRYY